MASCRRSLEDTLDYVKELDKFNDATKQKILRDKAAVDQQLAVAEADWLEAAEALQQAEE